MRIKTFWVLTEHTSVCQTGVRWQVCLCLILLSCRGRCHRALLEPLAFLRDGDVVKRGLTLTDELHDCCERTQTNKTNTADSAHLTAAFSAKHASASGYIKQVQNQTENSHLLFLLTFGFIKISKPSASNGTDSIFHHETIYRLCTAFIFTSRAVIVN